MNPAPAPFLIIGRPDVQRILDQAYEQAYAIVVDAYAKHHRGQTINPDSYFLRYPDAPRNRIIALPAHIGDEAAVSGIKWIASFPGNIEHGLQRASATLILNDGTTGYPLACLECGLISAVRTTLSALAGLRYLNGGRRRIACLGIVGTGFIARHLVDSLAKLHWEVEQVMLYDLDRAYAEAMQAHVRATLGVPVRVAGQLDELLAASQVIATATTAATPYISAPELLSHNPIVLNLSLRDFAPEIILASNNIVDDIDHCLKANTSPHLASQLSGNTDFINGHFGNLIDGSLRLDPAKPTIFSPFGLGVLDLALGRHIYDAVRRTGDGLACPDFFGETSRW